ncbi:MAG: hypothetical protein AAGF74_04570 [Pseudomonadota bacterium]
MGRIAIGVIIGAVVAGLIFFATNRPEPTPQERLEAAAEKAGEAVNEAVGAAREAASETGEAMTEAAASMAQQLSGDMEVMAAELSARVSDIPVAARTELDKFLEDWKSNGIVTEAGLDYERAREAVADSDLGDAAKLQIDGILAYLQGLPGEAADKVSELKVAIGQ